MAAHEAKLAAERKTLNAVEQGKHDVDQAKTAASGYVETAKEYVNSAIETAQVNAFASEMCVFQRSNVEFRITYLLLLVASPLIPMQQRRGL